MFLQRSSQVSRPLISRWSFHVFSDCRTSRLRKFELSLEGSSLFAMSAPPRKLDLVAFKTDFPSLHEFYHSWARLKKSDAADFQRRVFLI
jgi:hypothetical protein